MAEESITFLYGINTSARLFQMHDRNIHVQSLSNLSRSGFKLSQNFSLLRMSDLRSGKKHSSVGFRLVSGVLAGFHQDPGRERSSGCSFRGWDPHLGLNLLLEVWVEAPGEAAQSL